MAPYRQLSPAFSTGFGVSWRSLHSSLATLPQIGNDLVRDIARTRLAAFQVLHKFCLGPISPPRFVEVRPVNPLAATGRVTLPHARTIGRQSQPAIFTSLQRRVFGMQVHKG